MRKIIKWEHCAKTWYHIDISLAVEDIKEKEIVKCELNGIEVLFNTEEPIPVITQEMLLNGDWYVYTWSD